MSGYWLEVAAGLTVLAVGGLVSIVIRLWRRARRPLPSINPAFPFHTPSSIEELAGLLFYARADEARIEYQPRLPERQWDEWRRQMDSADLLLLHGPTGDGKTREALEVVRRYLDHSRPETVTILVPKPSPTLPRALDWPPGLEHRRILLFLDDLHNRYSPASPGGSAAETGDRRAWLPEMVAELRDRFPGSRLRVVVTVRDDIADWQARIGLNDPFWQGFLPLHLPPWAHPAQRGALLRAAARFRNVQASDNLIGLLAAHIADGKARSLVNAFRDLAPDTPINEDELLARATTSLSGQVDIDWKDLIAPHSQRRVLFEALSLLAQAGLTPYRDVALELAARLWGRPYALRRLQVAFAVPRVSAWVRPSGPLLQCPEAYLEGRADLASSVRIVAPLLRSLQSRDPARLAPEVGTLGNRLQELPRGNRSANLEEAIACYGRALEVYTREALPVDWAMTQNNLGNAYGERIAGERGENLEEAIACYGRALEVRTREALPVQWATTQNNLGTAYGDRIAGERRGNLEEAIACFRRALEVYTREALPADWAMTQNNLGVAYRNRIAGERGENLEEAIACFRRALEVYTREGFPVQWAATQNNLGTAYGERIAGERGENLEEAIACYGRALEVYTREALPAEWAGTQNNLGNALALAGLHAEEQGAIPRAVRLFEDALAAFEATGSEVAGPARSELDRLRRLLDGGAGPQERGDS